MTPEEAKLVLLRFRSFELDGGDPEARKALELCEADPELKRWFEEQHRFNQDAARALRGIPVPAELKREILESRKILKPTWNWRVLAIAASLALILGGLIFWTARPRRDNSFADFRERMLSFAIRQYSMDILTNDQQAVRAYLARSGAPADFPLPNGLASRPAKGGGALSWENHPVGMLCFAGPKNETLFLFVMDATAVRGAPKTPVEFGRFHRLETAEWSEQGKVFVLAAEIGQPLLKEMVDQ
jgi:hypothetical protein